MAVVRPLYYDTSTESLREMSDEQVTFFADYMFVLYNEFPSAALYVESTNIGNLATMQDTRLIASPYTTGTAFYIDPAATLETVTVNYNRLTYALVNVPAPEDTNNTRFPVYYDRSRGSIRAMSLQDVIDTLLPTIKTRVAGGQLDSYIISTSSSVSGFNLVSNNPIFVNTIANVSAYQASQIPEARDQPTIVNRYYLHVKRSLPNFNVGRPLYITNNNNLKTYNDEELVNRIVPALQYVFSNVDGYIIEYSIGSSGFGYKILGTGIVDTKLNSSVVERVLVNQNDYRSQRFPAGSQTTINTYYLRQRTL